MTKHVLLKSLTPAICLLACLAGPEHLYAQNPDANALPQRVPKSVEKQPFSVLVPELEPPTNAVPRRVPKSAKKQPFSVLVPELEPPASQPPPNNPQEEQPVVGKLAGVVIVKDLKEFKEAGVAGVTGLRVLDNIPLLSGPDFRSIADPYLGQPATMIDIKRLESDIIMYCRERNRPLVDVIMPPQDVTSGVIQLWFLEGKIGQISVENKGRKWLLENKPRKWFSDQFIKSQVRLRPLDPVDMRKLDQDMDWINRNPFRQVNAVFKPAEQLGKADLVLKVEDRFPVRPYVGYENSGTEFTGADRMVAGFNWGNAFGLDQQLNYQYTTDINFNTISAHSASYLIPLPWRHNLTVFGAYADTTAKFGANQPTEQGKSYQGSARYSIPTRVSHNYIQEITAGFDYKNMNSDLEFGGRSVSPTDIDVDQFELGYSGVLIDQWGQNSFGVEGYYSPGGLTSGNDDAAFNQLRTGSKDRYGYGRLTAERITKLPHDFSWLIHFFGQYASDRLPPSEEMGLGGFGTVRGYGERAVNGDDGWVLNNELRTPPINLPLIDPFAGQDKLQFLAFFDYGAVYIKDFKPSDQAELKKQNNNLSSVGPGLRYSFRQNFQLRFDYGFQLMDKERPPASPTHRSSGPHVAVLLSF